MPFSNPYYHHPQPAARLAADDVLYYISNHKDIHQLFEQGKMLGILLVEQNHTNLNPENYAQQESCNYPRVHYLNNIAYIAAFSGVVNGFEDKDEFFVHAVYDLQDPDDFYLQKDAEITRLNHTLAALDSKQTSSKAELKILQKQKEQIKLQRKTLSIELQKEIFSHFHFINNQGSYRNIIDIFADAKRGLPPGGSGECAAPRLLQYAYQHGLKPIELAEFWYGVSPRRIQRIHGRFYPSCIEKCSPILSYMLELEKAPEYKNSEDLVSQIKVIYEDDQIICITKPKDLLSTPAKDTSCPNVEDWLHDRYPNVHGPMLVHRLDQATSGILLAAKDAGIHKLLQLQFEQKIIQKRYFATVSGMLKSTCGIINLPLTVNPDDRPRQVVDWQFGKPALTYYEVINSDAKTTHVALYPLTGRTHQLRVHCASEFGLCSPILGDKLYEFDKDTGNQMPLQLHAESISFIHPHTGKTIELTAPLER